MNVKDKIKRLRDVVVSNIKPEDLNVLWVKKNVDSTYTFFINDGMDWVTPQSSQSGGIELTDRQLEAIQKAESIKVDGLGNLFLSNDGTYKSFDSFLSGYARQSDIPYSTSQLSNDSGFVTEDEVLSKHYTKKEVDSKIESGGGFDSTKYYTKESTDSLLEDKADKSSLDVYAKKENIPTVPTNISSFENDAKYLKLSDVDRTLSLSSGNPIASDAVLTEFNRYKYIVNGKVKSLDSIYITRFNECYSAGIGDDVTVYYDNWLSKLNEYQITGGSIYDSNTNQDGFFVDTIVKDVADGEETARFYLHSVVYGKNSKVSEYVKTIEINKNSKTLAAKNTYDINSSGGGGITTETDPVFINWKNKSSKIAIGSASEATGDYAVAIGDGARASDKKSISINSYSHGEKTFNIPADTLDKFYFDNTSLQELIQEHLKTNENTVKAFTSDADFSTITTTEAFFAELNRLHNIKGAFNKNSIYFGNVSLADVTGSLVTFECIVYYMPGDGNQYVFKVELSTTGTDSALKPFFWYTYALNGNFNAWHKVAISDDVTLVKNSIPKNISQLNNDSNYLDANSLFDYLYRIEYVSLGGGQSYNINTNIGTISLIMDEVASESIVINAPSNVPQTNFTYLDAIVRFTTGDSVPTVQFSSDLRWASGKVTTIEANTAYEFSISYCVNGWNIVGVGFKAVS